MRTTLWISRLAWLVVPTLAATKTTTTTANTTTTTNMTSIPYLASPNITWTASVSPLLQGNGVFLSTDDQMLLSTSQDGSVHSLHPGTGALMWTFQPTLVNNSIVSCHSGITFSSDESFFIYAIIDNEDSSAAMTRVIAVNASSGVALWQSSQLLGVASGTPVLSGDDQFVFLTHNSELTTVGHFTILSVSTTLNQTKLLFTATNTTNPYAPLGIYHSPAEGYYDGGVGNQNDILVWAYTAQPTDTKVGTGGLFAFQFPIGFSAVSSTKSSSFVVLYLGDDNIDFQSVSKPVLTNQGRSMYYAGSRSQWRCWVGAFGAKANDFNRARTGLLAFDRGTPASAPAFNTLALSSDTEAPAVFGGTAALQFARANYNFSDSLTVTTTSLVMTPAKVSPDDLVVYYIEVDGYLHQANSKTLVDVWVEQLLAPVKAESALSSDGSIIYVGDVAGHVMAYRVAEGTSTASPSTAPVATVIPTTIMPVASPTTKPVTSPTTSKATIKPVSVTTKPVSVTTKPVSITTKPVAPTTQPATAKPTSIATLSPVTEAPTIGTILSTTLPTTGASLASIPTVAPTLAQPVATRTTSAAFFVTSSFSRWVVTIASVASLWSFFSSSSFSL